MRLKPIKSEQEYEEALNRFEEIFETPEGTPKGDEAEILALLIEKYEEANHPIDPPDPIEAIKFRMEQMAMQKKDLANILGSKSRVTEILGRKRKLNLNMIRKLHDRLNIPYESLMNDYQVSDRSETLSD